MRIPLQQPPVESPELLREALRTLRQEHEILQQSSSHAQQLLDALDALLVDAASDPFERVFACLRKVFTFSQALLLAEPPVLAGPAQTLSCIVAEVPALVGTEWPVGPLFRKVMAGRVVSTFSGVGIEEWQQAPAWGLSLAQAGLYVPVRVHQRRGILMLLRTTGTEGFDQQQLSLARRFAVLVSHALAGLYASQSAAESERLQAVTAQLRQSEQVATRNAALLHAVVQALPVGVSVQDPEGRLLVVNDAAARVIGAPIEMLRGQIPFTVNDALPDRVQRRKQRFQDHLVSGEERFRERSVTVESRPHTLLVSGKPVQVQGETLLVSTSLDITERKRFEDELSRRAFHDQLTGLPNRTRMQDIVDAALHTHQAGGMFALAFIDLDNFKHVNDYYSHAIGDALLRAVSDRIVHQVRASDTLARISGDEFLLLINPLEALEHLPPLINRVLEALKQPFHIEGHEVLTSASVGASIYPLHGASYDTLRRCADSAMYRAKSERKGSVSYFELSMGQALTARMALEQSLRTALREQRFRAAFQPKVCLNSGQIVGFEALIRWVEADGRVVMPGTFIELATELGLIDQITHYALDDVLRCLPALRTQYGEGVSVSLNIAASQAGDVAFMQSLTDRLVHEGVARHVVLELTEDALVATQRFQHHVLPRLRALGVRVSIDDFGTGFSSLSTLADITADEVKVDRAFITAIHERPRSQGILKAIESLCAALHIDVVAEGVETAAEQAYLQQHTSIRLAQGYYYARPQFIEDWVAAP